MKPDNYTLWYVVGAAVTLALAFIGFRFIGAVVTGLFVYYSTRPVYKFLTNHRVGPTAAAAIAPTVFIFPVLILLVYTIRVIAIELRSLASRTDVTFQGILTQVAPPSTIREIPTFEELQELQIGNIRDILSPQSISPDIINAFIATLDSFLNIATQLSGVIFNLFIVIALSFYLLRDDGKITSEFYNLVNYDQLTLEYGSTLDKHLQTVFFGNILVAVISGLIGAVSYSLLSQLVPGGETLLYPALFGLLCGVGSLIPIIGMKIVYVPLTLVIFAINITQMPIAQAIAFPSIFLFVSLIIVDTIPDFLVRPYVSGRGGISTGLLLFSYTLGPLVFGWYGLFLGPLLFVAFSDFFSTVAPKLARN